jgi:hypothetical protein
VTDILSSDARKAIDLIRLKVGVDEHTKPIWRGPNCNGSAIKFPNPPLGTVSWLGNKRSYESRPLMAPPIVRVREEEPNRCGGGRERLVEEDPHAPPFERILQPLAPSGPGTSRGTRGHHLGLLIKITARKWQVSSCSSG